MKRIDGVIGTTLFYHFLATLDFPRGELVLRRKNAESLKTFAAESSEDSVAVPFWIASDHFMVGWGRVETMPPALLFVDTGLAGAGVKMSRVSTMDRSRGRTFLASISQAWLATTSSSPSR